LIENEFDMVIIGLGGLTKDILCDLLSQNSSDEILFFSELVGDRNIEFFTKKKLQVSDNLSDVKQHFERDKRFLVLIGNNSTREKLVTKYIDLGGQPHHFISPSANVNTSLSEISTVNTIIMNTAQVSAGAVIGDGVIVSQFAYVGHDVVVEKYAFLGAYSGLSVGNIGEYAFIGLKTVILPGRSVGKNALIGAFSMVNKSIPDNAKAYGIPAKISNK
jgi:acetyltransferase-like isoleucine patch superfamily enzyme